MKTTIVTHEIPFSLPHGAKVKLAKALGVHPNTIYNIRVQGETHPLYGKLVKVLKEQYGKPVKTIKS